MTKLRELRDLIGDRWQQYARRELTAQERYELAALQTTAQFEDDK